nr:hypothetical protein [Streptomyces incarnatus]
MQEQDDGYVGVFLTLRVSRDGGRTWGPRVTYRPPKNAAPLDLSGRFPPCACPRCRERKS